MGIRHTAGVMFVVTATVGIMPAQQPRGGPPTLEWSALLEVVLPDTGTALPTP
jgi:hypothetical protein